MRIAITAASGLIGGALSAALTSAGVEVVRLVRKPPQGHAQIQWDPASPDGGLDPRALAGLDGVVHLSGAPIAAGRWTEARKHELRASRIASTTALVSALLASGGPPPVLLVASAIGWYGDTGDSPVDERAPHGTGFLPRLVRDWEAAAEPASAAGIRVVNLRTGIVLARRGGMLGQLLLPFRLGLGARIGSGSQYLSWITLTDHIRACQFLLADQDLRGPVNLTGPAPVTNAVFTAALAAQLHRPALLRLPAGLLRAGLGELSSELLSSYRVLPARLQDAGFTFRQAEIGAAIEAALTPG